MIERLPDGSGGRRDRRNDFAVIVAPETEGHPRAIEFFRNCARFQYGPQSYPSREDAEAAARRWADQYAVDRVEIR